jgi:gamma-glutamylcyclotransferase (GGCT)/AIG2-like uncharacterized protein YtfP
MKSYFAYGSNLWREQMRHRCPDHQPRGIGVLKGYHWIVSRRGYANIVESEEDEVYGMIYEISESDEDSLDRYEGVHNGSYLKKMMMVESGGCDWECLVYVDPVEQEGEPKEEYIEKINKGISDARLPAQYVERYVRRFIPGGHTDGE